MAVGGASEEGAGEGTRPSPGGRRLSPPRTPLRPLGRGKDVSWVRGCGPGAVRTGEASVRGLLLRGQRRAGFHRRGRASPGGAGRRVGQSLEPPRGPSRGRCRGEHEQETIGPSAPGPLARQEGCRGRVVGAHALLGRAWRSTCPSSPVSSGLSGRGALFHPRTNVPAPEVRECAQGRMAREWQSQDSGSALSPSRPPRHRGQRAAGTAGLAEGWGGGQGFTGGFFSSERLESRRDRS